MRKPPAPRTILPTDKVLFKVFLFEVPRSSGQGLAKESTLSRHTDQNLRPKFAPSIWCCRMGQWAANGNWHYHCAHTAQQVTNHSYDLRFIRYKGQMTFKKHNVGELGPSFWANSTKRNSKAKFGGQNSGVSWPASSFRPAKDHENQPHWSAYCARGRICRRWTRAASGCPLAISVG